MARRGKRLTRKLKKTARKTRRSRRGGVDPVSKEKYEAYLEAKRKYEEGQKELQRVNATGTNEEYRAANKKVNELYEAVRRAEYAAFPPPANYNPGIHGTLRY
jgi:hypothetical protein